MNVFDKQVPLSPGQRLDLMTYIKAHACESYGELIGCVLSDRRAGVVDDMYDLCFGYLDTCSWYCTLYKMGDLDYRIWVVRSSMV